MVEAGFGEKLKSINTTFFHRFLMISFIFKTRLPESYNLTEWQPLSHLLRLRVCRWQQLRLRLLLHQLGWIGDCLKKPRPQGVSFWIPTGEGRLGAWLLHPDDGRASTNDSNPGTNEGRSSSKRNTILRTSSSRGCIYILYLHGISNHRSYSHRFL